MWLFTVQLTLRDSLCARVLLHRADRHPHGFECTRLPPHGCENANHPVSWSRNAYPRDAGIQRRRSHLCRRQRSIHHLLLACDPSSPARNPSWAVPKQRRGIASGVLTVGFLCPGWIHLYRCLSVHFPFHTNCQVHHLAGTRPSICSCWVNRKIAGKM